MAYQYPFKGTDEATKLKVWATGKPIQGYDEKVWRHDTCGKVMKYSEHGNTDSEHGWEIDHIKPSAKGGPNTWDNLQALNWNVNRSKSDTYPWNCSML
jgi:5-methylcytosine-specific restriction endonuclease McrA